MKFGISSYTYTWAVGIPGYPVKNPMTVYQLMDKAKELDVTHLQIADNMPLHEFSQSELTSVRSQADFYNLNLEAGSRGMTFDHTMTYIDIAEKIDASILRMIIDGPDYEPTLSEIINTIHQLIPELQSRRIRLAIENHDRLTTHEFLQIINAAQSEWVGICLDSVNSLGAGEDTMRITRALGPHTINFHVKDFVSRRLDHKLGFITEGTIAGQGMLPLAQMLPHIHANCQSAILEQWTPPEKKIEDTIKKEAQWAEAGVAYLKPFFD